MDFDEFARRAEKILAAIPDEFLGGVSGVVAHRLAMPDPEIPETFVMGECGDDEVAALTDPEVLRSRIHLYHGSFAAIARMEPDFDWQEELVETILHEIRHHIEDRAGILDLLIEDEWDKACARIRAGLDD